MLVGLLSRWCFLMVDMEGDSGRGELAISAVSSPSASRREAYWSSGVKVSTDGVLNKSTNWFPMESISYYCSVGRNTSSLFENLFRHLHRKFYVMFFESRRSVVLFPQSCISDSSRGPVYFHQYVSVAVVDFLLRWTNSFRDERFLSSDPEAI
ncbi:hypothetical protein TNCV_2507161 [Trichonephila clavipes]|nr:hypothetical protein TNCV_2507161 [Trichonephila clavipes]